MGCDIIFKIGEKEVSKKGTSLTNETAVISNIAQLLSNDTALTNEIIDVLKLTNINRNRSIENISEGIISNYTMKSLQEAYPQVFSNISTDYNPEILLVSNLQINGKKYNNLIYSQGKNSRIFILSPQNLITFKNFLLTRQTIIDKFNDENFVKEVSDRLSKILPKDIKDSYGDAIGKDYQRLLLDFLENQNYYSQYKNGEFAIILDIINKAQGKSSKFNTTAEQELYARRANITPTGFVKWAETFFPKACSIETNEELKILQDQKTENGKTTIKAVDKVIPIWNYISNIMRNDPNYKLRFILDTVSTTSVKFKDVTSTVESIFGYTFNTIHQNFVIQEYYKDYTIYQDSKSRKFIASKQSITPKSYISTFSTIEEVKAYVDQKYLKKDNLIKNGFDINFYKNTDEILDGIFVSNKYFKDTIVSKLDIEITHTIDSQTRQGRILQQGTINDFYDWVSEAFPEYEEQIRNTIVSNEQAGIFIGLYNDGLSIQNILDQISQANRRYYLITKSTNKITNKRGTGYIISYIPMQNPTITYNEHYQRPQPIISELENFSNILKEKGIEVDVLTASEISERFSDIEGTVKAFIENGKIYINGDIATSQDLIHEYAHLLLGILKAKNFSVYQQFLEKVLTLKTAQGKVKYMEGLYPNRAKLDIYEEIFADLFGEYIEGKHNIDIFQDIQEDVVQTTKSIFDLGSDEEISEAYNKDISIKQLLHKFCSDVSKTSDLDFNKGTIYRQASNKIEEGIKNKEIKEVCK